MRTKRTAIHLFRLFGVDVYASFWWLLLAVALTFPQVRAVITPGREHESIAFFVGQYLCLFAIVLTHEFGHALACKSVGGVANQIILWPLGGVAFVDPPPRPGALLWSIAAGPLVNVVLVPVTLFPAIVLVNSPAGPFFEQLALTNIVLLVFNLLPFYPLDGGQIVRALAWFIFGRSTSLIIAAVIGIVGAVVLGILALYVGSFWLAIVVGFMGLQSMAAIQQGNALRLIEKAPRHTFPRCPACGEPPPAVPLWQCKSCGASVDPFQENGRCPSCGQELPAAFCPFCGKSHPLPLWYAAMPAAHPA